MKNIRHLRSPQKWYYDVDRSFCLQVIYPKTVTPLRCGHCYEQQFRSPRVSSSIAIIIRGAVRKSMMEAKGVGKRQRKTKSRQFVLSRDAAGEGREGVVGGWDRANCFNKAAAERRTVVESGNWLGSSCAGGTAREGNIQIPSLLAQRIANAGRNRAEYYYSTILAVSTDRCDVRRGRSDNGGQLKGDKCILPFSFTQLSIAF